MTKADIVERLARVNGFTKLESSDLVETLFSIIKETLADGETLKIWGFGSLTKRSLS